MKIELLIRKSQSFEVFADVILINKHVKSGAFDKLMHGRMSIRNAEELADVFENLGLVVERKVYAD